MKTRRILILISLAMLVIAVGFVYAAVSAPTLGSAFYIGEHCVSVEEWRAFYRTYIIVMAALFVGGTYRMARTAAGSIAKSLVGAAVLTLASPFVGGLQYAYADNGVPAPPGWLQLTTTFVIIFAVFMCIYDLPGYLTRKKELRIRRSLLVSLVFTVISFLIDLVWYRYRGTEPAQLLFQTGRNFVLFFLMCMAICVICLLCERRKGKQSGLD